MWGLSLNEQSKLSFTTHSFITKATQLLIHSQAQVGLGLRNNFARRKSYVHTFLSHYKK